MTSQKRRYASLMIENFLFYIIFSNFMKFVVSLLCRNALLYTFHEKVGNETSSSIWNIPEALTSLHLNHSHHPRFQPKDQAVQEDISTRLKPSCPLGIKGSSIL